MAQQNLVEELSREKIAELLRLDRQQKEYQADVFLDAAVAKVLKALDEHTSIRWEQLPQFVNLTWPEICRGVTALANAGLCESGSLRVRISVRGHLLLSNAEGEDK